MIPSSFKGRVGVFGEVSSKALLSECFLFFCWACVCFFFFSSFVKDCLTKEEGGQIVGGLWVSGPRARSALGWSAAGGACGLAATAPWGAYTVAVGGPAFGLSSALFWVEAAVVPAVVLLGVPCPGGLWMFGARVFSMPASCLAGWGCCSPHTLLNIYMEEPYEHKRAHTHRCTLKHSHWCKNRCSQTHIVLICCCFKTYFVILVMCAAQ